MALAGISSCSYIRKPENKIYPYTKTPENLIPGKPIYYATSYQIREEVTGLLVENHEGRPTKIEGNPLHPNSLGASNVFHQASVLSLYDPDRFKKVAKLGKILSTSTLSEVNKWIEDLNLESNQGEGVAILTEYSLSPTHYRLINEIEEKYPKIRIFRHEPVNNDNMYQGIYDISGTWSIPIVDYFKADVVVSLNSDFLGLESGNMQANHKFMKRRRVEDGDINRLYQFENTFSITGGVADHRFKIKRSEVDLITYAILRKFYKKGVIRTNKFLISYLEQALKGAAAILREKEYFKNLDKIADDLSQNISRSVVVAGAGSSPLVHSLVYYINHLIKAPIDYYVHPYAEKKYVRTSSSASIKNLALDINKGKVRNLIVMGDPIYSVAKELEFNVLYEKINTLHLESIPNATSFISKVVIPRSDYLETWSDQISTTGLVSLVQPLINPLYDSISDIELLSLLLKNQKKSLELVKNTSKLNKESWKKVLHNGVGIDLGKKLHRYSGPANIDVFASNNISNFSKANKQLEITFDPDYSVFDGRFVNNSWLQELPDPITKITWGNVILISNDLAKKEGLSSSEIVELTVGKYAIEGVVWVMPGQEDMSISIKYGYGQKVSGKVGTDIGFNAFTLKSQGVADVYQGSIIIRKLGRTEKVATVQGHWKIKDEIFSGVESNNSQNNRKLFRQANVEEYKKNPSFAKDMVEVPHLQEYHDKLRKNKKNHSMFPENMSVFNEVEYTSEYQWGMSIDLSTCTGCNACTIACQAENNIPVVGKEMVLMGRELHWIRIDRYFEGNPESPQMVSQPVNCLQCEQAPCEQVCPVAATVHSNEGLNDMVYNRCIGTRFCSNNCPVKVRRFNYFDFHQRATHAKKKISSHIFELFKEPAKTMQYQFNPDVTVRMRGVMEKCTYCVQRINRSRVEAKNQGRKINDGEVKVACEQVCPTGSIVFGNIKDTNSKVSRAKSRQRDYHMLAELNIKPRTSYLAAIKNPNKRIDT